METFWSPDFLKFFLPLVGGVIAWFVNENRKRRWEEYLRKEERYRELIRAMKGFYVTTQDSSLKQAFIEQINLCWLYCPDEVINKAYAFLDTVHTGKKSTDEQKEGALGNFMAAIRTDLLARSTTRRTSFSGRDFQHLGST